MFCLLHWFFFLKRSFHSDRRGANPLMKAFILTFHVSLKCLCTMFSWHLKEDCQGDGKIERIKYSSKCTHCDCLSSLRLSIQGFIFQWRIWYPLLIWITRSWMMWDAKKYLMKDIIYFFIHQLCAWKNSQIGKLLMKMIWTTFLPDILMSFLEIKVAFLATFHLFSICHIFLSIIFFTKLQEG